MLHRPDGAGGADGAGADLMDHLDDFVAVLAEFQ